MTTLALGYVVDNPVTPPTVSLYSAGGTLNGVYKYAYTFVTGNGETEASPVSTIAVANQKVLFVMPTLPQYSKKIKIYRSLPAGTDLFFLKSTKIDFIDDGSVALTTPAPTYSSADARQEFRGEIRMTDSVAYGIAEIAGAGLTTDDATEITSPVSVVTSTSVGGGVRLPTKLLEGNTFRVLNKSGAVINIYPSSGKQIDSNPVDSPISIDTDLSCEIAFVDGQWTLLETSTSGVPTIATLGDVSLGPLVDGNVLSYNGVDWTNRAIVGGDSITATVNANDITLDADDATVSAKGVVFGSTTATETVLGSNAALASPLPNDTVAIGVSLPQAGPISGEGNVLIGTGAFHGSATLTTGDSNVIIGRNAGSNIQGGSGNVLIGNGGGLAGGGELACVGIGQTCVMTGGFQEQIAIGSNVQSQAKWGIAMGAGANARSISAVAIGANAIVYASNPDGVALGYNAKVDGDYGVALGSGTLVSTGHDNSVAIGLNAATTASNQFALSNNLTEWKSSGLTSHADGTATELLAMDTGIVKKGIPVQVTAAATGDLLYYNGTRWVNRVPAVGEIHFTDFAAPTSIAIGVAGTYYLANVAAALRAGSSLFSSPSNGRLTYTGADTRYFHCLATCSVKVGAGASREVRIRLHKGGVYSASSDGSDLIANATNFQNITCQQIIQLAQNDYIELYVTNATSTDSVDFGQLNIFLVSV